MSTPLIVAVDDDLENIKLVENCLKESGYNVICFEDGAEAWSYIQKEAEYISVIVLAKTLPNIGGMEILAKIRSYEPLKKTPVIIQTIDDEEGKYKNALELGAQFYLNKPIDTKKLLRLIKASIRTQSRIVDSDSFVDKVGHVTSVL